MIQIITILLVYVTAMLKMGAVEEQQKRFKKLSTNFSKRLAHHLNNLFIHQVFQVIHFLNNLPLPTAPSHPDSVSPVSFHPRPPSPNLFFFHNSMITQLSALFQNEVQSLVMMHCAGRAGSDVTSLSE